MFRSVKHSMPDPVTGERYDGSRDPEVIREVDEYLNGFSPCVIGALDDPSVGGECMTLFMGSMTDQEIPNGETFVVMVTRDETGWPVPRYAATELSSLDLENSRDCARGMLMEDRWFTEAVFMEACVHAMTRWGYSAERIAAFELYVSKA